MDRSSENWRNERTTKCECECESVGAKKEKRTLGILSLLPRKIANDGEIPKVISSIAAAVAALRQYFTSTGDLILATMVIAAALFFTSREIRFWAWERHAERQQRDHVHQLALHNKQGELDRETQIRQEETQERVEERRLQWEWDRWRLEMAMGMGREARKQQPTALAGSVGSAKSQHVRGPGAEQFEVPASVFYSLSASSFATSEGFVSSSRFEIEGADSSVESVATDGFAGVDGFTAADRFAGEDEFAGVDGFAGANKFDSFAEAASGSRTWLFIWYLKLLCTRPLAFSSSPEWRQRNRETKKGRANE
ncbi:hypothetical protein BDZ91DRAFT_800648 [Kalaharituber pfeilii]|nr:hypothetical protein BDZ91DRAFT_800648 [Kalaharituber pfeilii]